MRALPPASSSGGLTTCDGPTSPQAILSPSTQNLTCCNAFLRTSILRFRCGFCILLCLLYCGLCLAVSTQLLFQGDLGIGRAEQADRRAKGRIWQVLGLMPYTPVSLDWLCFNWCHFNHMFRWGIISLVDSPNVLTRCKWPFLTISHLLVHIFF